MLSMVTSAGGRPLRCSSSCSDLPAMRRTLPRPWRSSGPSAREGLISHLRWDRQHADGCGGPVSGHLAGCRDEPGGRGAGRGSHPGKSSDKPTRKVNATGCRGRSAIRLRVGPDIDAHDGQSARLLSPSKRARSPAALGAMQPRRPRTSRGAASGRPQHDDGHRVGGTGRRPVIAAIIVYVPNSPELVYNS